MSHTDIQPADAGARRITIILLLVAVVVCGGVYWLVQDQLREISELAATGETQLAGEELLKVLQLTLVGLTVSGLLLGGYVVQSSLQILRSQRFPAPGVRVVRDTPIRRGRDAQRLGTLGVFLGGATVVLTLVGAFSFWMLLGSMFHA